TSRTRAATTVAAQAWTVTNAGSPAPGGSVKQASTALNATTGSRNSTREAHAASGMSAHSTYQGWTTGKHRTTAAIETPSPPTGLMRLDWTANGIRTVNAAATRSAAVCTIARTCSVWSPSPRYWPIPPTVTPRAVGGESQLRNVVAAPSLVTHPVPDEVASIIAPVVMPLIAVITSAARTVARAPPPHRRASAMPTKPRATTVGSLTSADPVTRTVPATSNTTARRSATGESIARRARTSPTARRPIISDSEWIPETRWNSTSGFATASHRAATSETPQYSASRGTAHPSMRIPSTATIRCRMVPATTSSPVREWMTFCTPRNSGPYWLGVSRHMSGTLTVSACEAPSAETGPSA